MEKNISIYNSLGYYQTGEIIKDSIQNNYIVFMETNAETIHRLELISPMNEKSSIRNFKCGLHHICYEGEPGKDLVQKFKEMRIGKIYTKPITAPALHNREVVFACLQNGIFVELIL